MLYGVFVLTAHKASLRRRPAKTVSVILISGPMRARHCEMLTNSEAGNTLDTLVSQSSIHPGVICIWKIQTFLRLGLFLASLDKLCVSITYVLSIKCSE